MYEDLHALYRAIERLEHHIATTSELLATLRAGHKNARRDPRLRDYLQQKIDYHIEEMAALHAERERLQRAVTKLRRKAR